MLSTRPPADLVPIRTIKELNERGYRRIVVELIVKGLEVRAIREHLAREYGIEVQPNTIRAMVSKGDRQSMLAEADALVRRRLQQSAIDEMEHLKAGYRAAEQAGDKDAREHYARMWQSWWDRVGKFYLPQEVAGAQINILIADPKVMVREEVRNADDAARILARLESTEAQRQSDQGVKRAEDAARPEEAAEPK